MNRAGRGGFTLLELLVVIVVLALISVLILSRGPAHNDRLDVDATVRRLAGGLRLARSEAIVRNHTVAFTLDPGGHAYRVDARPPVALPASVALELVGVSDVTLGKRTSAISFAPDGSSSGGRIELRAARLRSQVQVDWLTGRVSVMEGS